MGALRPPNPQRIFSEEYGARGRNLVDWPSGTGGDADDREEYDALPLVVRAFYVLPSPLAVI